MKCHIARLCIFLADCITIFWHSQLEQTLEKRAIGSKEWFQEYELLIHGLQLQAAYDLNIMNHY